MEINFKGKRALVTGAGKGIGRDVVKRLVELGADTVALSRTQEDLDSLKEEVPSVTTVHCDLSDWDKTREAVEKIEDIDLLVNNAGIAVGDEFLNVKKEDIDSILDVNFKAVFNVSQVIANSMVARKCGGAIVNVSSAASMQGVPTFSVYCSSKAALDKLTNVMALELGQHKIRVNSVNPTVVMTRMARVHWSDPVKANSMLSRIPMNRFVEIHEVVDSIVFLLSDKASMIDGVLLPIEGGLCTS